MHTLFSKYCPTITRLVLWLWNSPTFTTWGNYGVQSLRLVLVTPFILTRFDETEIAAWYLFASLNFFGMIVSQRLGLTFSRMFAFAMGGASNLAPIKGKREQENEGKPNWSAFERAYGTIGSINFGVAWLNVLIALGMGWFGLSNILQGYDATGTIWLAFGLMQGTSLLTFIFQQFQIALQGMNYVALVNRWAVIFGLVSCIAGSCTLFLGGGLITFVFVMQFFTLAGILRNWFLLRSVESGRVGKFRLFGFDREVFRWGCAPAWKGFLWNMGVLGNLQLTAVIYTAFAGQLEIASFLFGLRMMQTITQMAQAPFMSKQPLLSRLLSAGEIEQMDAIVKKAVVVSMGLTAVGILSAGVVFPVLLDLVGANIQFLGINSWLIFGALTLLARLCVWSCSISAIGNEIILYWEAILSAILSAMLLVATGVFLDDIQPVVPIITSTLPLLFFLNIKPFQRAALVVGATRFPSYFYSTILIFVGYVLITMSLFYYYG